MLLCIPHCLPYLCNWDNTQGKQWVTNKNGAPVGIIRGYAAHPVGVAVALLWRCLALGARLELGVRTNSPDDVNKKPQLMVWGLVLLVKCGAAVGIDP